MTVTSPRPTVRTSVPIPLRLADGYSTVARAYSFIGLADDLPHLALELGHPTSGQVPLVRPHSECVTGDVFGSERCDCGGQLNEAVRRIEARSGYLLYLRQEGRGIGLYDKLDAYALQDQGLDTYDANLHLGHAADERDYTVAAQMLQALGAVRIALLSNNPDKVRQLTELGIDIVEQVPTEVHASAANVRYLSAKRNRGHTLNGFHG